MHFFHSVCTEVSLCTCNTVQFICTSSILSVQKSPLCTCNTVQFICTSSILCVQKSPSVHVTLFSLYTLLPFCLYRNHPLLSSVYMHFFHSVCTEVSPSTRNTVQFIYTSCILCVQKSPSVHVTLFSLYALLPFCLCRSLPLYT
jgi:hypothetical protein